MNQNPIASNAPLTNTGEPRRAHKPSWVPIALVVGALALAAAAYAAMSRDSGETIERQGAPSGSASGRGTDDGLSRPGTSPY